MNKSALGRKRLLRLLWLVGLYFIVASLVTDSFMSRWGLGFYNEPSTFTKLMDRTADRPYVYRALMPWMIDGISESTPQPIVRVLERPLGENQESLLDRALDRYAWSHVDPLQHFVGYLLLLASAFGVCWSWRSLARWQAGQRLEEGSTSLLADLAPAVALLFLPLTFGRGGYLYDMPELFLLSIGFLCFLTRRYLAYYLVLAIAMLNKESSVLMFAWFLGPILGSLRRPGDALARLRSLVPHALAHAAIGGSLLSWLYWIYRDRAGSPVEFHLLNNLTSYVDPHTYFHMVDIYSAGLPVPQGFHLVNIVLFSWLLLYGWRQAPIEVRRCFCAAVLVVLPLFVAFGYRDEIRVFDIAFPAGFLLAWESIRRLYDVDSAG